MNRRNFVKLCGSVAALAAAGQRPAIAAGGQFKAFGRARLVTPSGQPVKAAALQVGTNYVFHYPFVGTPVLLLRLGAAPAHSAVLQTEDGATYEWSGGVGPGGAVVAYSAICQHQLSAVFRNRTFISFRPDRSPVAERENTIVCCAHHSVYDPLEGGKVLSGPAAQPLAAIVLDYDPATDALFATGTLGAERFHDFFAAYRRELIDEFGRGAAKNEVSGTAVLQPLQDYARETVSC
jgi:arsenite oxidase small subunit